MYPMVSCDHLKGREPPSVHFQLEDYICSGHLKLKQGWDRQHHQIQTKNSILNIHC